jgi:ABC-type branched-subunit amino acid transport system substrate-binding protein
LPPLYLIVCYCLLVFYPFGIIANTHPEKKTTGHPKVIKLGVSNAVTGPVSNLGKELIKGANSYFSQLNAGGGINGSSVKLITLDDGYEPNNAVINTKKLLALNVLALFGYVGTPTSYAIMPILNKSKTPYLMPFTGADFLRSEQYDNIINLRASYYQELESQIDYLISIKKFKKLALVIQADEFGLAAQRAVRKILKGKQLKLIVTARYRRNTNNIEDALTKLSAQHVDAAIFVGTSPPFIRLINLAHQQKLDIVFTSLSFIGSHNLMKKIPDSSKVVLSEVMPSPEQCRWELCQQFIIDMQHAGYKDLNRIQLEGYLNAFVFSQVAKKCGDSLNQECLLRQFKQFNYQDNTLRISFSNNNQGLQQVYFTFSNALKSNTLTLGSTY